MHYEGIIISSLLMWIFPKVLHVFAQIENLQVLSKAYDLRVNRSPYTQKKFWGDGKITRSVKKKFDLPVTAQFSRYRARQFPIGAPKNF